MKDLKIFTKNIEEEAIKQINELLEQEAFKDSKVRIMPDVHAGKGCVIGFTGDLGNKVIPNIKFDYELVKIGKTYKQLRFTFNGKALNYTVIQDDMYFRTFDKFKNICNLGQYCNADESPECRYCKLKIKNRYE